MTTVSEAVTGERVSRPRWDGDGGVMVDRYAAAAFNRYCAVRGLSSAQARAELEPIDDLVLTKKGLRPGEAGRWLGAGPARTAEPPLVPRPSGRGLS
jgi:hypothetical protein